MRQEHIASSNNLLDQSQGELSTALSAEYRPRIKALLVDAAGTLISPSEPVAEVTLLLHGMLQINQDTMQVDVMTIQYYCRS